MAVQSLLIAVLAYPGRVWSLWLNPPVGMKSIAAKAELMKCVFESQSTKCQLECIEDDSMPVEHHFHLAPQQQHAQLDRMRNKVSYFGEKNAIHAVLMIFLLLLAHCADFKSSTAFNMKHKRT